MEAKVDKRSVKGARVVKHAAFYIDCNKMVSSFSAFDFGTKPRII